MYSVIKIECIGASPNGIYMALDKMMGGILGYADCFKKRWWVAQITGECKKYKFERNFLSPMRDYTKSNSKGSRGVYASYFLEYGKLYEVSDTRSNRNTVRYFCIGDDPQKHLTKEEALEWLRNQSE